MRKGNILMLGASAAAMMAFQPAIAQDGAQEDEIVVQGRSFRDPSDATATKLSTPLAETASIVTIYSDEFLDDIGITSFTDAVNYVPGVSSYGNGYDSSFFFVARGFGVSDSNGIRINGAPIGDDYFFDNIAFDRLEYVKGANAASYGEISAAGLINVALKEASSEELEGTAQIRFDTFDTVRGEVTYGGPLNESGTIRGIVGLSSTQSGEYYRNGDSRTDALFTNLAFDATDRLTFTATAYIDDRFSTLNSGLALGEDLTDPLNPVYSIAPQDKDFFAGGTHSNVESQFFFGQVQATYEINDQHSILASYSLSDGEQQREQQESFGFGYGEYVNLTPSSPNFGDTSIDSFANDRESETTHAELRWTGEVDFSDDAVLSFIVSGEYYNFERVFTFYDLNETVTPVQTLNIFNPLRTDPNPFQGKQFGGIFDQSNEVYSISTFGSLNLWDRLRLNAGIRYDEREGINDISSPDDREVFTNELTSYSASIVYDILENLHVYYAYGEGFEYGGALTCDGSTLDPEENTSNEIGLKWEPNSSLIASVALFDNGASNTPGGSEICPEGSLFVTGIVGEDSDQFGEGIEFELLGSITPAWNISAGFSYIDDGFPGSPFVTPEQTATMFTTYDFLEGPLQGLGFGIGFRYEADRPQEGGIDVPVNLADIDGFDPDVDESRSINFNDAVEDGLGDFFIVDAAVYYQLTDNVDLALNIQNLNDEEAYASFGDPFFQILRQPPRNVAFTVNIDF